MADTAATLTTANGWAKEVFGDVQRLSLPKTAKASKRIKFNSKKKLGKALSFPIWLTAEGGFTEGTGSTLNDAKAATSKEASLTGAETTLRALIDIKTLTSHMSDKDSFGEYFGEHLIQSKRAFARRLETNVVYGGVSIGQLSAVSGSSTTRTLTVSPATFAPHVFLGTTSHQIDAYNATTKLNTNAAIEITSVNTATGVITVSGNADDLTAVTSAGVATELYWRGAYGNTMAGLYKIGSNTASETYAGINHASYPDAWQGSTVAVGSVPFSWNALNSGLEKAAGKGCECPLIVQVSLKTWGNLINDIAALRMFDSSYRAKEGEFGVESIKFHGVTGMPVVIEPSGFIKGGHAIAFPNTDDDDFSDLAQRVGSSDVTIMHPAGNGQMIVQVPGTNYFETKFYSDQAAKVNPRDLIVWTGIVPA